MVGRNENETKNISEKLGCTFTIADVLKDEFLDKVKNDISEVKGIAYCVGSIDLKPLRMVNEQDFNKCMKLNLYSAEYKFNFIHLLKSCSFTILSGFRSIDPTQ